MQLLPALWRRNEPLPLVWALLTVSAAAVGTAGYLHGRLFWEGYAHVAVVGPLFWLNAVGTGVVIIFLLLGRALLYAISALLISLGAIISILISHTASFFRFAEAGFDSRAALIMVAEVIAASLILIAAGLSWAADANAAAGRTGVAA